MKNCLRSSIFCLLVGAQLLASNGGSIKVSIEEIRFDPKRCDGYFEDNFKSAKIRLYHPYGQDLKFSFSEVAPGTRMVPKAIHVTEKPEWGPYLTFRPRYVRFDYQYIYFSLDLTIPYCDWTTSPFSGFSKDYYPRFQTWTQMIEVTSLTLGNTWVKYFRTDQGGWIKVRFERLESLLENAQRKVESLKHIRRILSSHLHLEDMDTADPSHQGAPDSLVSKSDLQAFAEELNTSNSLRESVNLFLNPRYFYFLETASQRLSQKNSPVFRDIKPDGIVSFDDFWAYLREVTPE